MGTGQRLRESRLENGKIGTFTVHRWRLDDEEVVRSARTASRHKGHFQSQNVTPHQRGQLHAVPRAKNCTDTDDACVAMAYQRLELAMSLYSDHLLHLVHFNALRGLVRNKSVIATRAAYFTPASEPGTPLVPYIEECYPGSALLVPVVDTASNAASTTLDPTQQQSSIPHSVWINLLPFPTWRNNLITWERCFNHAELVGDVIGNLIDLTHFFSPRTGDIAPPTGCGMTLSPSDIDKHSNNRTGLILWGEPHIAENWEFTAGFLRKWGWTLRGCEYIVESTNRWRLRRGEEPMQITPS